MKLKFAYGNNAHYKNYYRNYRIKIFVAIKKTTIKFKKR